MGCKNTGSLDCTLKRWHYLSIGAGRSFECLVVPNVWDQSFIEQDLHFAYNLKNSVVMAVKWNTIWMDQSLFSTQVSTKFWRKRAEQPHQLNWLTCHIKMQSTSCYSACKYFWAALHLLVTAARKDNVGQLTSDQLPHPQSWANNNEGSVLPLFNTKHLWTWAHPSLLWT